MIRTILEEVMKVTRKRSLHLARAIVICATLVLTLSSDALCKRSVKKMSNQPVVLKCGDEAKIIRNDGSVITGRVTNSVGNSFILSRGFNQLITVPLEEVSSIHRVRRHTVSGAVLGIVVGAAFGVVIARAAVGGMQSLDTQASTASTLMVGSVMAGGILGAVAGNSSKSTRKVRLEVSPVCAFPSGKIEPVGLTLAINF